MNKEKFWELIDYTLLNYDGDFDSYLDVLENLLSSLTVVEIIKWDHIFNEYLYLAQREKLWAAAYLINDGCDEDEFDFFLAWLISLGKKRYLSAVKNPDSLHSLIIPNPDNYLAEFEELLFVAETAFSNVVDSDKKMTEEEIEDQFFDVLDANELSMAEKKEIASEVEFSRDSNVDWDEEDLDQLLPKLYHVYYEEDE